MGQIRDLNGIPEGMKDRVAFLRTHHHLNKFHHSKEKRRIQRESTDLEKMGVESKSGVFCSVEAIERC